MIISKQKQLIGVNQELSLLKIGSKAKIETLMNRINQLEIRIKKMEMEKEDMDINKKKNQEDMFNLSVRLRKKEEDLQELIVENSNLIKQIE